MDPQPISEPTTPIASPKHQTTPQSPVRVETSIKTEEPNSPSSDAILSPVSERILESALCSISSTISPPLQIMGRPEDHSNRRSSSSEWSSVSNESLFSIHITHSDRHDHGHLLAEDAFAVHDSLTFIKSFSKSDVDDLVMEALDDLDEPQKVVRWKTQVEHHADEGASSQGQQCESSPLTDHKSSEPESFVGHHAIVAPGKHLCGHVGIIAGNL
ncbi:hypothetical protein Tco_1051052 [Tanacetum coccineum]